MTATPERPPVEQQDLDAVERQLGRIPRGVVEVAHRCPCGEPDVLRTLPPRQRAALVLRYFEDLTEAQTAEVMGIATGTVKSLSHQAVARMRAELSAHQVVEQREGRR